MVYLSYNEESFWDGERVLPRKTKRFKSLEEAERYVFMKEWAGILPIVTAKIYRKAKGREVPLKAYVLENGRIKSIPLV